MTHPVAIPPELLRDWSIEASEKALVGSEYVEYVATKAGQYCADRELEACCEWIDTPAEFETVAWNGKESDQLRAARRPKPPSLKERALEALEQIDGWAVGSVSHLTIHDELVADVDVIRRALESLPD